MGIRVWLVGLAAVAACGDNTDGDDRQGGDTTVDDRTQLALLHPAANLTDAQVAQFRAGTSPFDFHWEIPQLGRLYNNDACFGCHGSNGRGLSQIGDGGVIDINGPQSEALVRISVPTGAPGAPNAPIEAPGFGLQLQDHATVGLPEVFVTLSWDEHEEMFGDGEVIALRQPHLAIRSGNGDPMPADAMYSYRTAPALTGLGLLEAIDEASLDALADPDDRDGDGISGKENRVWDPELGVTMLGRFGWKANTSRLRIQAPGAAVNDMGLTNKVFPPDDGSASDVQDDQLDAMVFFVSTVGVPAAGTRDGPALHGRRLFDDFGCTSCHVPALVTGDHPIAPLAHQTIHPYTDLLVHDMGAGLADGRPDFLASGSEWRTPALWGIGLAQVIRAQASFLHDGRARTFAEAIMWHGGEATAARDAFRTAAKADRDALTAFLGTL